MSIISMDLPPPPPLSPRMLWLETFIEFNDRNFIF